MYKRQDYGNSNSVETAQIAFAIGAHYADKEDWESARKAVSGAMSTLDKAPPDIQVQAHATLARALMHLKSVAQARGEYDKVRRIWGDGSVAQAKINEAYKSEGADQQAHKLGKALDAVGEALFYAAEDKKKEKVESLPFPKMCIRDRPSTTRTTMRPCTRRSSTWRASTSSRSTACRTGTRASTT